MFRVGFSIKVPEFKESDFLSRDHWLRYKMTTGANMQVEDTAEVVDEKYTYYIIMYNDNTLVVGTDDSGKLFSMHTKVKIGDYYDQKLFRFKFFGFRYHWWEAEKVYEDVDAYVRLQGDLIAEIQKLTNLSYIVNTPGFRLFLQKRSLEKNDMDMYYASIDLLDVDVARRYNTKVPYSFPELLNRGCVHDYIYDLLENPQRIKVVWGRHRVYFKGLQLLSSVFLALPPKVLVKHPEHGVTEFKVKHPIVIYF